MTLKCAMVGLDLLCLMTPEPLYQYPVVHDAYCAEQTQIEMVADVAKARAVDKIDAVAFVNNELGTDQETDRCSWGHMLIKSREIVSRLPKNGRVLEIHRVIAVGNAARGEWVRGVPWLERRLFATPATLYSYQWTD
jgi:hypothetical protein